MDQDEDKVNILLNILSNSVNEADNVKVMLTDPNSDLLAVLHNHQYVLETITKYLMVVLMGLSKEYPDAYNSTSDKEKFKTLYEDVQRLMTNAVDDNNKETNLR